jgi:hypothetical protein
MKTSDMPDKLGCTHSINASSGKISTKNLPRGSASPHGRFPLQENFQKSTQIRQPLSFSTVQLSIKASLWISKPGDPNPYSVSSRIFSRSTKRTLWRNTILMSINGLIFGDGNSTTSKYQLLLVQSQYQLLFISGKNWSITHSLQELQLFLLASWKRRFSLKLST